MSPSRRPPPPRRPPSGPPEGSEHRAALEALRARMEAAARTPPAPRPRRRGRRGRTAEGADGGLDDPGEGSAGAFEDPAVDAPTPLEDPESPTGGRWWDDHPGQPIPVEDGIAAATRRGPIGASWWSRRFLGSLEAVLVGGRMERGRSYARKGQVAALTLGPGDVSAVVQGSRSDPYRVRLTMPVATEEEWERIIATLGAQAGHAARLLAGDLPHEVEGVFAAAGASLFPGPQARLVTECTCPDFENPCKHIAAVCYLVAEMFDRDPFRVLEWRGKDRAAVVDALRSLRNAPTPGSAGSPGEEPAGRAPPPGDVGEDGRAGQEGAEVSSEGFWVAGPGLADVHVLPVAAPLPDAVLRQLPRDLLHVRGRDVADVLAVAYDAFTAAAGRWAGR